MESGLQREEGRGGQSVHDSLLALAWLYFSMGRYKQAGIMYRGVMGLMPGPEREALARRGLAAVLLGEGRAKEAIKELDRAEELAKGGAVFKRLRAEALWQAGQEKGEGETGWM